MNHAGLPAATCCATRNSSRSSSVKSSGSELAPRTFATEAADDQAAHSLRARRGDGRCSGSIAIEIPACIGYHRLEEVVRVGYLIPEFPGQTHVFFWREIVALRARGVTVRLLSTRRPAGSSRHEFAAAAAAETH